MRKVLSISLGELVLKGGNRKYFEDKLLSQIKKSIIDLGYSEIYKDQGKIYIIGNEDNYKYMIKRLQKIFGIVYISLCIRVNKDDFSNIEDAAKYLINEKIIQDRRITFKVETSRSDKKYHMKSPEISRSIGASVLKKYGKNLKVDVHNPEFQINIDIKRYAYVYIDRYEAYRGLPIGTNGEGLLLLSGGIDSPVAGFLMGKRGVKINCVHYHSYPFTSERAEDKVKKLAKILSRYTGEMKFYSVNILDIQKAINENCPKNEMTILSRRFMMRIAEKIAIKNRYNALISGESLGQVASQTIQSMGVINSSVNLPVLRPLVGMDKIDIIDIAKDIETYETSIIPFVDSCTVFLPDNPVIKPKLEDIKRSEQSLNIDDLVNNAILNMEEITIS